MKFLGISLNISELTGKIIFRSCDVILPSFACQDGGIVVTSYYLHLHVKMVASISQVSQF